MNIDQARRVAEKALHAYDSWVIGTGGRGAVTAAFYELRVALSAAEPVRVPCGLVQYLESMLHQCKSPLMLQIKEAQQQAKELEAWLSWLSASPSPAPAVPDAVNPKGDCA